MFYDVYKQVFLQKNRERGNFGYIGRSYPGIIQFLQMEHSLMDQSISPNEIIKIDEAPVSLVFNNVESLDVVINQLLNLRKTMGGN